MSIIPLFQSFTAIAGVYQGRRASRCSALAPGFYISRLWRFIATLVQSPGYLLLDNTFEHEIGERELLERHVGLNPNDSPTPFLRVVLIETLDSYLAQI